jgi:hypothetical protein
MGTCWGRYKALKSASGVLPVHRDRPERRPNARLATSLQDGGDGGWHPNAHPRRDPRALPKDGLGELGRGDCEGHGAGRWRGSRGWKCRARGRAFASIASRPAPRDVIESRGHPSGAPRPSRRCVPLFSGGTVLRLGPVEADTSQTIGAKARPNISSALLSPGAAAGRLSS